MWLSVLGEVDLNDQYDIMYYLLLFSLEKKPQKKTNIKCNVIKSTIYIQGELD
jgi:hypothetical protein